VYYARAEDGSWRPATCDEQGKYHMPGDVRVATRDMQLDLFKNLHPVFEVLGQRKILLVAPLPRYITAAVRTEATEPTEWIRSSRKRCRMTWEQ
jgi:hypothetical protein